MAKMLRTPAEWRSYHFDHMTTAITRYAKLPRRRLNRIIERFSRENAGNLAYLNPWSDEMWQNYLYRGLVLRGARYRSPVAVTAIHPPWNTNTSSPRFNLAEIRGEVEEAFSGLSYLVMIEFAVFRNVSHGGGRLIAPHIQGLVFGDIDNGRLAKLRKRFGGGMDGAHGLWLEKVTDLAGAVRYLVKPPVCGYSRKPLKNNKVKRPIFQFSYRQRFRTFELFRRFIYPDLTIGGRLGATVLRDALYMANKRGMGSCDKKSNASLPARMCR